MTLEPATAEPPSPRSLPAGRASEDGWFAPTSTVPPNESRAHFRPLLPLRVAAFLLAPVPLLVALSVSGVTPAFLAVGFSGFLVLLALVRAGLGAYDLRRGRRLGDALLRAYPCRPPADGLAAWRSAELTSARNRRRLTRLIRQLRRETEICTRSSLPQVDSAALDESVLVLRRLERRLETLSDPVSAVGMLDLYTLATGRVSPLYFPENAAGLPATLSRALAALEAA